jgi:hypothetical protein
VFTFCVLPDENDVDVVVSGLDSLTGLAVQNVNKKIQRVSQFNVSGFQV